jgi:D-cysteine desulfhydrase
MFMRPLFHRWPKLSDVIACEEIAELPTPVIPLTGIHERLWMKCDNLTHTEYGGNKIRKLEFIIPELKQKHIKQVISLGGTGTNSGTALAMVCRDLGIACRLYLFEQETSANVQCNYALMQQFGAELLHVKTSVAAGLRYYLDWRRLDPRCYFLYAGCSNAVSVFGYVNAMLELKQQVDAGICAKPDHIFVATGSCSTLAGMLFGCALLQWDLRITGVRVAPDYVGPVPGCTAGLVSALMQNALKIMVRAYPEYRALRLPSPVLTGDYYGAGYSIATPASRRAQQRTREHAQLELENTYTAKAFAAVLDAVEGSNDTVLFWNTHHSRH